MSAGSTKIVVGVDGSPSSRAALRWAVKQAVLTGETADAVTAWRFPMVIGSPFSKPTLLPVRSGST